jgi:hypothetical protein
MKFKKLLIAALIMGCTKASAQSFAINTTGAAADNSAILDITSTSKGMLVPRVSTAQRTAIASPAKGLMVYDSTVNQFAYYNGTAWQLLNAGASSWTVSGTNQYSAVTGQVGIGTATPTDKLHVVGNLKLDGGKMTVTNSSNSVYVGNSAGQGDNLSTVLGNTAIGTNSMVSNASGYSNTAVGYEAMRMNNVSGAAENTVVGAWALRNNTTGVDNAVLGSGGGISNVGGSRNTFVGRFAGRYNNGSNNVFLGNRAGQDETGSDKLYISNSNTTAPLIYGDFANHLLKVNGTLNVNDAYNLPTTVGTANQVLQTNGAGQTNWVNATSLVITETDPQVAAATTNYIPKWNGTALVDGIVFDNGTSVGIGMASPLAKLHVKGNFMVETGRIEFRNNGQSVFVGENAGLNDNLTLNNSTFIGHNSGQNNVSGGGNVAVGANALYTVTSSNSSTAVGTDALRNAPGAANTALGYGAGSNATGAFNVFIGPTAGANESGNSKLYIDNSSTSSPLIYGDFNNNIVTVNGNLGIGTTTPTQAKLVVNGSQAQTFASYGYLNRTHPTGTINSNSTSNDYSIYATDRIAAPEFNAFSDARIKDIKGKTNNAEDLKTLTAIEITNYSLKDSIGKGSRQYKKVIAQQVEKAYPLAVTQMTDVVPDIYQRAEIKEGIINLSTSLQTGDKVKLIFESGVEMATVTAATGNSFTVDTKKTGKVFVFGREVSDFRTVDYEALSTLNISATQELAKKIDTQQQKIEKLEAQLATMLEVLKKLHIPASTTIATNK